MPGASASGGAGGECGGEAVRKSAVEEVRVQEGLGAGGCSVVCYGVVVGGGGWWGVVVLQSGRGLGAGPEAQLAQEAL